MSMSLDIDRWLQHYINCNALLISSIVGQLDVDMCEFSLYNKNIIRQSFY